MANAFNYSNVTSTMNNMQSTADELAKLMTEFINLIDSNVNNPNVWMGSSSADFKTKWNNFSDEKFPEYKEQFAKKIQDVKVSIAEWSKSEQGL